MSEQRGADEMSFTIKAFSYCPVCRGKPQIDCRHTMRELRDAMSGATTGVIAQRDALTAEVEQLRVELQSVLNDWNDLTRAIGAPANGTAIGHAAALAAEVERLQTDLTAAHATIAGLTAALERAHEQRDGQIRECLIALTKRDELIAQARAEERERCAAIASSHCRSATDSGTATRAPCCDQTAHEIADAILGGK